MALRHALKAILSAQQPFSGTSNKLLNVFQYTSIGPYYALIFSALRCPTRSQTAVI
jgi:hypothetical protein